MIVQLLIGVVAITASVLVHALFMVATTPLFGRFEDRVHGHLWKSLLIAGVVVWFFLSICVQCWGWAVLFLALGALPTFEEALYFSTVTYTTVGYGDIVLDKDWRLLGAFESALGMIIIGWTTALVFIAVQRVFRREDHRFDRRP
jgi:hypothetical protein